MMEKFRRFGIVGIMFMLMVSIVSASVLDYYGKVTETAQVSGPIFYGDGDFKFLINTKPSTIYEYEVLDSQSLTLFSEDLNGINFDYNFACYFGIKAGATTSNQNLRLVCGYRDTDDNDTDICSAKIIVSAIHNLHFDSCSSTISPTNVKYFYYKFVGLASPSSDISYHIETNPNGDTRIEVSAA